MKRLLISTSTTCIGNSTINFDKIAKEQIYESINKASLERLSFIREKYKNLKYKLGKIPYLTDFYNYDELDPMFILNYIKGNYTSYPQLLPRLDKELELKLTKEEQLYLKFISLKIANGKRPQELYILKKLIDNNKITINQLNEQLSKEYSINNQTTIKHACTVLDKSFYKKKDQEEYEKTNYINKKDNLIEINQKFKKLLSKEEFKKNMMDLITLGLKQYKDKYHHENINIDPFKYYEKYTREDVVRLLNLKSNDSSTIYGYRTKEDIKEQLHCPIFVTYNKKETISKSTQYEDKFINQKQFSWMTRSNLKIESKEVQQILNHKENGNKLYLFINKSDDEGKEFYYIGQVTPKEYEQTTIKDDKGKEKPIVNIKLDINKTVKKDIYDYLIS